MPKFRKGDVVRIEGCVLYDVADEDEFLFVGGTTGIEFTVRRDRLTLVCPAVVPGDVVKSGLRIGLVLAADRGLLWVRIRTDEDCSDTTHCETWIQTNVIVVPPDQIPTHIANMIKAREDR